MSYDCEKCSKTFAQRSAMTRHLKRCNNQMVYQCPVESCRKTFSQSSQLRAHENVHTKKKPYACGIGDCPAKFGDPSSKARHIKEIHRTTHINVCPVAGCNTRIKRNSAYNAHLKQKHGILDTKPYSRLRQPVLQSPLAVPTSSSDRVEPLPNPYTTPSDQRNPTTPLLWRSSIPQALTPPQTEPINNNISVYSRTRSQGGMLAEDPVAMHPELFHWASDARAFRLYDSAGYSTIPQDGSTTHHDTTMPLIHPNFVFQDELFNNFDIYNTRSLLPPSNSQWNYGAYDFLSDTNSESAPPSVYSSDLASLGLCSPTNTVLPLPC